MKALKRKILALGIIACLSVPALAQINNTLYFMPGVPQSNRINPAKQPQGNIYVGIPLVSPARGGFSSSSAAYKDIIQKHPTQKDSLVTFLHPLADKAAFMDNLKPINLVVSNLGTSLVSVGFRTEVGFFSVDFSTRVDGTLRFPADMVHLMVDGTQEGRTYNLDGLGADLFAFTEASVGWSRAIMDNLTIGARAKVLFGIGDLSTVNSELSVTTSEDVWNIQSNMVFNTSLGFADVMYDADGNFEEIVIDEELTELNPYAVARYAFSTGNLGFGIDIGAEYRPIEPLLLSVSLVDLGYIKWTEEVHQASYIMEYDYRGIEVNPFEFSDDYSFSDHLDSSLSQMADSLSGFFQFAPGEAYSRRLNSKLYVGASYFVTPKINFGLISRTDFLKGAVSEQLTLTANYTTGRFVNLALSYSYINSKFNNIGAGASLNIGPLNLYLVSDNILNALFWPTEARYVNIWLGLNLVFGYKEKLDSPLVN